MSVICIGEALIDFVCVEPVRGKEGGLYVKKAGGAPANVAAAISLLGGESYFAGALGEDSFGEYLASTMQDAGVHLTFLQRVSSPTTLAFVTLQSDGDREFEFLRGADADYKLESDACLSIAQSSIVHFGSATAFLDGNLLNTYLTVAGYAAESGNIISFDPNYRVNLWGNDQPEFKRWCHHMLDLANLVKVSEEELALLTQASSIEEGCKALHKMGVEYVFVTLGPKGCHVSVKEQQVLVPAFHINAIDTTGAGDAFIGALLYSLDQCNDVAMLGMNEWQDKVAFAQKVSAMVCVKNGAMNALPTLDEVSSVELAVAH